MADEIKERPLGYDNFWVELQKTSSVIGELSRISCVACLGERQAKAQTMVLELSRLSVNGAAQLIAEKVVCDQPHSVSVPEQRTALEPVSAGLADRIAAWRASEVQLVDG